MLKKIAETMAKAGSIAILPHIAADGDAIGSSLALAIGLSGTGKDVRVLLEEKVPQIYSFLPGLELAGLFDADDRRYDLAVALDCGDLERLGSRRTLFEKASITVNIDHHPTNPGFAALDYTDPSCAASAEIIYALLGRSNVPVHCHSIRHRRLQVQQYDAGDSYHRFRASNKGHRCGRYIQAHI
jgi:phosphoesterase RecJ-like protein